MNAQTIQNCCRKNELCRFKENNNITKSGISLECLFLKNTIVNINIPTNPISK